MDPSDEAAITALGIPILFILCCGNCAGVLLPFGDKRLGGPCCVACGPWAWFASLVLVPTVWVYPALMPPIFLIALVGCLAGCLLAGWSLRKAVETAIEITVYPLARNPIAIRNRRIEEAGAYLCYVPDEDTGDVVTLTLTLALIYLSPTATHRH